MPSNKGFSIRAAGGEAEVLIYEPIDSLFGISAKRFRDELKAAGEVSTIHVRINSPGGSVFECYAIYNTLRAHQARVIVHVDGAALSAASVVAMAGDEIEMAGNAWLMIHNPISLAIDDADGLHKTADLVQQLTDQLVAIYAQRTRLPADEIALMMDDETWLNAKQAVQLGFADRVTDELAIAASFDTSRFRNTPRALKLADPFFAWSEAIAAELKAGAKSKLEAGRAVDRKNPELRQALLAGGKPRKPELEP